MSYETRLQGIHGYDMRPVPSSLLESIRCFSVATEPVASVLCGLLRESFGLGNGCCSRMCNDEREHGSKECGEAHCSAAKTVW